MGSHRAGVGDGRRLQPLVTWLQDERATVTAEFAAALPAALLVIVLAVATVQASALQLRVVDAASIAARTIARGQAGDADDRVGRLVGEHTLATSTDGSFVCAAVSAPVSFGALGAAGIDVSARSCALAGGQ